ncbi:hypothetical protein OG814_11770 [Streptomyces zaomyceticus]|uniref:Secreted protein n=1 Tax=Streptomyces zaomyceticus TaxID=68286 RepID=A0ABZ1L5Z2_9ACTN
MEGLAVVTGIGGFVLGVLAGGLGVWGARRRTQENPAIQLNVRRGGSPGEYVLSNTGFRPAWSVVVRLKAHARSTLATVTTEEHWREIADRSEVPFVVNLGEIASAPYEAEITWYGTAQGGKLRTKTVQIQRGTPSASSS